jgi:hypothetical protein
MICRFDWEKKETRTINLALNLFLFKKFGKNSFSYTICSSNPCTSKMQDTYVVSTFLCHRIFLLSWYLFTVYSVCEHTSKSKKQQLALLAKVFILLLMRIIRFYMGPKTDSYSLDLTNRKICDLTLINIMM